MGSGSTAPQSATGCAAERCAAVRTAAVPGRDARGDRPPDLSGAADRPPVRRSVRPVRSAVVPILALPARVPILALVPALALILRIVRRADELDGSGVAALLVALRSQHLALVTRRPGPVARDRVEQRRSLRRCIQVAHAGAERHAAEHG